MPRPKSEDVQGKPPLSYIYLCAEAILHNPNRMATLSEIYDFITKNYPYYQRTSNKWQNSLRHNLSYNDCFVKVERKGGGKGNYWRLHADALRMFDEGSVQRRKKRFVAKNNQGKKTDSNEAIQPQENSSPPNVLFPSYTSDISYHDAYMRCQLEEQSHKSGTEEAVTQNASLNQAQEGTNFLSHSIANILKPDSPKRKKRPVAESPSPQSNFTLDDYNRLLASTPPGVPARTTNQTSKKLKSTPVVAPIPIKPIPHAEDLASLYYAHQWSAAALTPEALRSFASDQNALLLAQTNLHAHHQQQQQQQQLALLRIPNELQGFNPIQSSLYNHALPFNPVEYFSSTQGYNNSLPPKLEGQNYLLCA